MVWEFLRQGWDSLHQNSHCECQRFEYSREICQNCRDLVDFTVILYWCEGISLIDTICAISSLMCRTGGAPANCCNPHHNPQHLGWFSMASYIYPAPSRRVFYCKGNPNSLGECQGTPVAYLPVTGQGHLNGCGSAKAGWMSSAAPAWRHAVSDIYTTDHNRLPSVDCDAFGLIADVSGIKVLSARDIFM
jgi:hypothetical protein